MPTADEIQTYLAGAWRLMSGRPDGIRMLDVSADGFWNSFFAIVIALPAMVVGWVTIANDLAMLGDGAPGRLFVVVTLAFVDLMAWIVPLVALAVMARPLGVADRFVHLVVANNWASVLIVWLLLPPALIRLVAPDQRDLAALISLALFGVSLVLSWRLMNATINRGAAPATAVFVTLLAVSFAVLIALQALFGLGG
ncbi:MAG: transporter [Rhizobiaceae bacterium]|nr:transporter [Rhizobiaceae bacterium]MCV0404786.1 transporter [Rhizobiaceae bacterium]